MEQVFEALGLNGLTPTFQWAVLVWLVICVGVIPLELYWWFSLRRSRSSVDLSRAKATGDVRPAFLGEDAARKQERIARGDAYAGPASAVPAQAPEAVVRKVAWWRRILLFALVIATMGVIGWLIFGDPFVGIEDAVDLGAARNWKDVLSSCWMLIAVSVARVAMWVYELQAG